MKDERCVGLGVVFGVYCLAFRVSGLGLGLKGSEGCLLARVELCYSLGFMV